MGRRKSSPSVRGKINIVSIGLAPKTRDRFLAICDERGMTIKMALSRMVSWFSKLDLTEQALVLGHVDPADEGSLASILHRRK